MLILGTWERLLVDEFSEPNVCLPHQLIPIKCLEKLAALVPICIDQLTHPLARANHKALMLQIFVVIHVALAVALATWCSGR